MVYTEYDDKGERSVRSRLLVSSARESRGKDDYRRDGGWLYRSGRTRWGLSRKHE